jgi:tRNA(adenine34) deaminase
VDNFWNSLALPWRVCLEEAWGGFCAGSLPIGAAVTDAHGEILSSGRNRRHDPRANDGFVNHSKLAHAELNALIRLPEDDSDRHSWILFTTTEPCPLCMGAIYMSGVRELHYASRDPYAGSTNLLGKTPYLSRKSLQISVPTRQDLEDIMVAMVVYAMRAECIINVETVLQVKREQLPMGTRFGEHLYESQILDLLQSNHAAAQEVYNRLAEIWRDYQSGDNYL